MEFVILVLFGLSVFLRSQSAFADVQLIDDEDFKLLPKIYEIGRPELCNEENEQFCQLTIKLSPENAENPSKFWKIIEETRNFTEFYDHDILKYVACVNTSHSRQNVTNSSESSVSLFYTKKFKHLGLVANSTKIDCQLQDYQLYQPKLYDWIVLSFVLTYATLTIFATICDFTKLLENKYLLTFSVKANYRKMIDNCDAEKLKFVQGIRFYATLLVIASHTCLVLMLGYVDNTEYFEELSQIWWKRAFRNLFSFAVQPFFVISGWFLSYGTLKLMKNRQNNKSPWKFVFLTFLNRCLRLFPVLGFLMLVTTTTWLTGLIKGPVKKVSFDGEIKRCRKNWWMNLIFINNFVLTETCCSHTWYISADTQLYLLSLIILAIIWKFDLNFIKTFLTFIPIAILLQFFLVYFDENISDVILIASPRTVISVWIDEFYVPSYFALYFSPFARMSSYFIGICFGYFYFQIKEEKVIFKIKKISEFFWNVSIFVLPLITLTICNFRYGKLLASVWAALLNPIFALSTSLGILGMATISGGTTAVLRAICEWKPIVFLGNMTYSVYLMQITYIFSRAVTNTEPFQLSEWILLKYFMTDVIAVYFLGFLTHLLVELPMVQLQNLVVPKMK